MTFRQIFRHRNQFPKPTRSKLQELQSLLGVQAALNDYGCHELYARLYVSWGARTLCICLPETEDSPGMEIIWDITQRRPFITTKGSGHVVGTRLLEFFEIVKAILGEQQMAQLRQEYLQPVLRSYVEHTRRL